MNQADFLERLEAYGADLPGVRERFTGDMELYEQCFDFFLSEPSFPLLRQYIQQGDYTKAFEAAHALKGTSANLGLTPFCTVVHPLVESLRAGSYENINKEYEAVDAAFHRIAALRGTEPTPPESEPAKADCGQLSELLNCSGAVAMALFDAGEQAPRTRTANFTALTGLSRIGLQTENGKVSLLPCERLQEVNRELARWDGTGEYVSRAFACPDGYCLLRLSKTESGQYLLLAQEVTRLQSELLTAEQKNEAKTQFLVSLSHGIRTPLNAIVNMTQCARDAVDCPERQQEYLQILGQGSDHLMRLLNDVLDMRHLESGKLTLHTVPFLLRQELERACDIIRPDSTAKKQTLLTDFSGLTTQLLVGDPVRVTQVFLNLLNNAVAYTQENGTLRISARELPNQDKGGVRVRIVLEDNGKGMTKEELQDVFVPFFQTKGRSETAYTGTGLGLPLCRSYVAAMGGTIACESEPGRGTTFTVELPFRMTTERIKIKAKQAWYHDLPFAGMNCLLCEDNQINRIVGRTVLENIGFTVDIVNSGQEGIQKFLSAEPDCYDIIFMDIQMPVMDGCQTAVRIRMSDHPRGKTIPIIAMSADAFVEDIERAHRAGMDGYVNKPVAVQELIAEIERVFGC